MTVKLLTKQSLKGGCTGWYESTLVKMPHCWKSHVTVTAHPISDRIIVYVSLMMLTNQMSHYICKCIKICLLHIYQLLTNIHIKRKYGQMLRTNVTLC